MTLRAGPGRFGIRPRKGRSRLEGTRPLQLASAPRYGPSGIPKDKVALGSPFPCTARQKALSFPLRGHVAAPLAPRLRHQSPASHSLRFRHLLSSITNTGCACAPRRPAEGRGRLSPRAPQGHVASSASNPHSHLRPCSLWEVTRFPFLPSTARFLSPKVSLSRRDL